MTLVLTILAVFGLLVASEMWWRLRRPHDELSRKFIHIVVGSLAAFWPFYMSWGEIVFLSAAFVVVVVVSKYFGVFTAIHAVQRPTWGEICFALAVGTLAAVTQEPWIYAAALLHMSLADGLAAVIGVTYGRATQYKILGHVKSVVGTLTFLITSVLILAAYAWQGPGDPSFLLLAGLALTATALENLAVKGLDNIAVPLLMAGVLAHLG